MTFNLFYVTLTFSLLVVVSIYGENFTEPLNFPKSLNLNLTTFKNWGESIQVKNVWTIEPQNKSEILQVANWARQNGYQVRASGLMQNWSPLTLLNANGSELESTPPPRVILLKMTTNLNKMAVTHTDPGRSSFWAEPGITMEKLLENLESQKLELVNIPSIGKVTLGGVLATGGHGSKVESKNDQNSPDGPSYGSLSNLILSMTAIVYSRELNEYTEKEFKRNDTQMAALLVNLGRVIITNVTMRARSLTYLRCESILSIPSEKLFAHPDSKLLPNPEPEKSLAGILNSTGMLEVTIYPFTNRPWLKKWTRISKEDCNSTRESTTVNEPYNYPFLDNYPNSVGKMAGEIQNGSFQRTELFGPLLLDVVVESLELSQSGDMCGPSKNTLLYVQPSSLKFSASGWAILTQRVNVQRVVYEIDQYYRYLLYSFGNQGKFPVNGPISFKITGMDEKFGWNGFGEIETPALSPTSGQDQYDTVVWFDISTFSQTPYQADFMVDLEKYFAEIFNGDWALLRGDWTKGWGYKKNGGEPFLKILNPEDTNPLNKMEDALNIFNKMDPFNTFTNGYLSEMLKQNQNLNFCALKENGSYVNPLGACGSFYICSGGQTQFIQCPPPLHVNMRTHRCDLPEDAGCEGTHFFTELESFPFEVYPRKYKNWAGDIVLRSVWSGYPKTAQQVVDAANWARKYKFEIRASGFRHTWAPITVGYSDIPGSIMNELEPDLPSVKIGGIPEEFKEITKKPGIVLLKTRHFMNKMGIISTSKNNASFWAEPGITMEDLLKNLQDHKLGLLSHPAPGQLTLGGVLAIGGHGAGVNAEKEKLLGGHTFGSLSNLIISFTAVVYDNQSDAYILKEFNRTDPVAKVFLVSLGRTFITNVTMRAGPLLYYQCVSTTRVTTDHLFAAPDSEAAEGNSTFSTFLDNFGRVESILFPFTDTPWLKFWRVVTPEEMNKRHGLIPNILPFPDLGGDLGNPRRVIVPYNYPFSDFVPELLLQPYKSVAQCAKKSCTKTLSEGLLKHVQAGLLAFAASDIWGESRFVMNYLKSSTFKVTANGYAVITSRKNIQRAVHQVYKLYNELLEKYAKISRFPINVAFEMRMTNVDNPDEVLVDGAEPPALSALHPVEGHDDWDTAIWINMLSVPGTLYANDFYAEFEDKSYKMFNSDWSTIRIEWSKGWAYKYGQTYNNEEFIANIANTFPKGLWNFTVNTFNKYDPHKVFSNDFLNKLLVPR